MAEEERVVTERICKIVHKQVDEKFDGINACIKEIRDAVSEMREIAAGTKEIIAVLMEERKTQKEISKTKPVFWDTDTKKAAFKWSVILVLVVIVLLAGRSLAELFDIIPK